MLSFLLLLFSLSLLCLTVYVHVQAVSAFHSSDFAREAFGDDVVDHYSHWLLEEQARLCAFKEMPHSCATHSLVLRCDRLLMTVL